MIRIILRLGRLQRLKGSLVNKNGRGISVVLHMNFKNNLKSLGEIVEGIMTLELKRNNPEIIITT